MRLKPGRYGESIVIGNERFKSKSAAIRILNARGKPESMICMLVGVSPRYVRNVLIREAQSLAGKKGKATL